MTIADFFEAIVEFLTTGFLQNIIKFIKNTVYFFINPIAQKILSTIPIIDFTYLLIDVFNFITPYINYILDFLLVSDSSLRYLIYSIIFRCTIRLNSYLIKLILSWYHKLMP